MTDNASHAVEVGALADPDCLHCMRKKLRATSVVVFFKDNDGWRLSGFQGDKPFEAAEVEFQYMLKSNVPDAVIAQGESFILSDDAAIRKVFPLSANIFLGQSLIGATVRRGDLFGVRIAWRDQRDPFTSNDLETIECHGECPDGCI